MKSKGKYFLSVVDRKFPKDKPIVFWDTCALLDIVRIYCRTSSPEQAIEQYEYLADRIIAGDVLSITSEMVFIEFNQHFAKEISLLRAKEEEYRNNVKNLSAIMTPGEKRRRIESSIDDLHTETRITKLLSKIWRNTVVLLPQRSFLDGAYNRVKYKWSPSKNKEQFKDSYIWVTFLHLARCFTLSPRVFFFTRNTKDYYDNSSRNLDTWILTDITPLANVSFHVYLGQLYSEMKKLLVP